jgi:ATP-dependent Lon protease
VERFLGPARHYNEELLSRDRVGVATGLAWTAAGGDLMFIEVVAVPGKGELLLTGQLGGVMKESAQAALSFARTYAGEHGPGPKFFSEHDIHVHVPAGSIPKDGPSAGITIASAIISVLSGKAISRRLAMSGEITLRGDVLPIGGIREKVMAARLAGVETVLLPRLNERDLAEVPAQVKKGLQFQFAEHMDEVLDLALLPTARGNGGRGKKEGAARTAKPAKSSKSNKSNKSTKTTRSTRADKAGKPSRSPKPEKPPRAGTA